MRRVSGPSLHPPNRSWTDIAKKLLERDELTVETLARAMYTEHSFRVKYIRNKFKVIQLKLDRAERKIDELLGNR